MVLSDTKSSKFTQLPECLLALAYNVLNVYTHAHTHVFPKRMLVTLVAPAKRYMCCFATPKVMFTFMLIIGINSVVSCCSHQDWDKEGRTGHASFRGKFIKLQDSCCNQRIFDVLPATLWLLANKQHWTCR